MTTAASDDRSSTSRAQLREERKKKVFLRTSEGGDSDVDRLRLDSDSDCAERCHLHDRGSDPKAVENAEEADVHVLERRRGPRGDAAHTLFVGVRG